VASVSRSVETRVEPPSGKSTSTPRGAAGRKSVTALVACVASSTPSTPPTSESSRLSASRRRTSRARLAPSESWIAISLRRPLAEASERFATFTATMSSTPRLTAWRRRRTGPITA